ncbi:hypothetical protein Tco_0694280 [Tanacetum coccineum]
MMLPVLANVVMLDMTDRLGEEKTEELTYLCNSPSSCSQEFVMLKSKLLMENVSGIEPEVAEHVGPELSSAANERWVSSHLQSLPISRAFVLES